MSDYEPEHDPEPAGRQFDPKVISRIAHVLWRIENETVIKRSSKEDNVDAWKRDKAPYLDEARKILRLAKTIEITAKD